ncbi:MAG: thioredoxin-disulfide reductase [Flavobacteriales bacterium]|jgi:thioredoxin reductase (NADPH)|nr:thioredoxin-disulfide reductase [Flavobacteriales bacterium]|tara:strand:+ start:31268 stop:32203 length:936 start_codon:yes stop_codon:yes gene_type:complete
MEIIECLIIGSGPAGYTAAIYASRANLNPVLIQGLQPGGQLTTTNDVENYPGYPEGVTGPIMMEDFKKQAERFGSKIVFGTVTEVILSKTKGDVHKIIVDNKEEIYTKTVIISTGASAKYLGLESEKKFMGSGVSACAVCDGFFFKNQDVVVVGGGDSAAEEATYLAKLCKKVYLLVRKDEMRASQIMQKRVFDTNNLEVLFNHETIEVMGDKTVNSIKVKDTKNNQEKIISASGFFLAIGHTPNTQIFKNQLDMDSVGYLITKPDSSITNLPGVFASGDAQDSIYRQAITAAGSGCMAALDAERYLSELD